MLKNIDRIMRLCGRCFHTIIGHQLKLKNNGPTIPTLRKPQNIPRSADLKIGATMENLKNNLRQIMGLRKGYQKTLNLNLDREKLNSYLAADSIELPTRTIKDSFLSGVIPLSTDEKLQEQYLSNLGNIRYGRLIEDMDIFAVMVLQKYILNPQVPINAPSPYTVITVLMDSMLLDNYKAIPNKDVRISGHIANVGRSSAEVVVWLEQQNDSEWNNITHARFIMAARDASNKKSAIINPLNPTDAIEHQLIITAKHGRKRLHDKNERSVTRTHPTTQEQAILHQLFIENCRGCLTLPESLPSDHTWIGATTVTNTLLSFPENRNLHNTIFGGYIMRKAIELAYSTSYIFTNDRGRLRGISQVKFNRPIPVGAIIQMQAQIAFTKLHFLQIAIHANAIILPEGVVHATNTFQFTFEMPNLVHSVFPKSYQEAMQFIDASRHLDAVLQLNNEPFHHIDYNTNNETHK